MTYILSWSNPSKTPITLADSTSDTTTSLILTGKGFLNWGQPLQQNLMHLLENFAAPTPPSTFTLGQSWFDSAENRLNVNIGPTGNTFKQLAYRDITSQPVPTITGDVWYDSTLNFLNVFDATWQQLAYFTQAQGNYSVDTGGANAYVVALVPAITTYQNNFVGRFKVGVTNTGASTINAGGGVIPLLNNQGGALVAGDLIAGSVITYIYIKADNHAYVTSSVLSQNDAVFAAIAGNNSQTFQVSTALSSTQAVPLAQAQQIGVPIGTIIDFAGTTAPTGYVKCPLVQTLVSTSGQYAALYAAIGTTWGSGSGVFGLPYFAAGYAALQTDTLLDVGTHTAGQVIAHSHTYDHAAGYAPQSGSSTPCWSGNATYTSGTTGGADNLAGGMRVMKCVKYQ
jgi:hypothetical protein